MNLFELQAVLSLNSSGYKQGLDDAEKQGNGFLGKVQTLTGKVGKAWGTLKSAAQGASSLLSPVINVVTSAVEAYGDYEQAVGGVRKLFGSATKTITNNAMNAFKTAGMSINDYMELCIQSGATMLKSVGEDSEKAAQMMDLAIIDMADNVNALGTDMSAVMNAYRGFSRGNFTMLDNLALGFAGTKEGMEALLAVAGELDDTVYDINSYADIVQAIHTIQQSRNITGTSTNEGTSTIVGSKAYMEAAKQNMLIVLADKESTEKDKEDAAKAYGEAVGAYIQNLIPVIKEVVKGLFVAIKEIIPALMDNLPAIINLLVDLLLGILQDPSALQSIIKALVYAFVSAIAGIFDVLLTMLISIFKPEFQTEGTAFSQWGVYDWIKNAFGYGEMTDRNGNTVEISGVKQYDGKKTWAEYFVPEGMWDDPEVKQEVIDLAKEETLEGAEALLELAFGKTRAGVKHDATNGMTKVAAAGFYDQTFGATDDAIYYIYKLLEREGYDIERLKAMRDAGASYDAEQASVWERNGEKIELPEGVTQTMAENFIKAVAYATEGGYEEDEISNEAVRQLLEKYGDLIPKEFDMDGLEVIHGSITAKTAEVTLQNGKFEFSINLTKGGTHAGNDESIDYEGEGSHAKGLWSVPYDDYVARLHRDEMVLTASQAREYRNGGGMDSGLLNAINGMRNDLQNLQLVVGDRVFGSAVVDYSGRRMQGYIGEAEDKLIAGYGWG